ncbi:MAG TPA: aldo/keto reductase [Acidimicrobiales bacterium]
MESRTIGSLSVSVVGLGCNNFGTTFGTHVDVAGTRAVVDAAIDHGITLLDTADVYGDSEAFLGEVLRGRRERVLIATKFGSPMGAEDRQGASARWIAIAVEDSLRRLGVETIDIYQLHRPDSGTPIEETLAALDKLVREGKVREIGHSNFSGAQIDQAAAAAEAGGFQPFASAQNELSVLRSRAVDDALAACARHGIGMLPYSPLANGLLTGKYRRGAPAGEETRLGHLSDDLQQRNLSDRMFDRVEALTRYAGDHGHSLLELAMSWLLAYPAVSSVIAGATKPEQVVANVEAVGWQLSPEEAEEIRNLVTTGG